ncbi:MAG: hypothetical protein JSU74_13605 [Candidatus Zixiibacteriota bacterium]|nr:MAG: hypothetical protein JSU74_13605 [candidate division Zixibacteria bacterium]
MKLYSALLGLLLAAAIFQGCCEKVDLEAHRQELLRLNETMRAAHLEGDAETIVAISTYPYTKVNSGKISHPTKEENDQRFQNYMTTMKLSAWDDLQEPIITMSDDATLATVIYRKHLAMTPVDEPDTEPMEGIYAWQSTYKRTPEGWKQVSDVLTSLPEDEAIEALKTVGK